MLILDALKYTIYRNTPHPLCGVFILSVLCWRRPTLACTTTIGAGGLNFRVPVVEISLQCFVLAPSYSRLSTTIASGGLNCRVRNENGCGPSDKALAQNTEEIISADFTTGHRRNAWPVGSFAFLPGRTGVTPPPKHQHRTLKPVVLYYAYN